MPASMTMSSNDRTRIPQFFRVAAHVLDMDRRRQASLTVIGQVTEWEQRNALARNAENWLVVSWVQWSLLARTVAYRYALERLILGSPTPMAGEVERSIIALQDLIADHRLLPGPDLAPGAGVAMLPPYDGPPGPPAPGAPPPGPPPRRSLGVLGGAAVPDISPRASAPLDPMPSSSGRAAI